jgi:hypothetical protein
MRKSIIDPPTTQAEQRSEQEWLDLELVVVPQNLIRADSLVVSMGWR